MRRVIIESPYAGDVERNIAYARRAVRDSILRGESPYASHLLIPGSLDDNNPAERDLGIRCGYAWWKYASLVVFYIDLGWSRGMNAAMQRVKTMHMKWEIRRLADNSHSGDAQP